MTTPAQPAGRYPTTPTAPSGRHRECKGILALAGPLAVVALMTVPLAACGGSSEKSHSQSYQLGYNWGNGNTASQYGVSVDATCENGFRVDTVVNDNVSKSEYMQGCRDAFSQSKKS